ncbi:MULTISPECIES: hypothetical protein [Clostridia]|uniref:hypothetical protein n=1 Tax=Clostridium sp. CCUG 7971 TaxID=2811414 RepID=UPI001ABAD94B|nr:hypothetical protein [Clostridium sp. CCUG 7971]MBO3443439.1 hypothetical protein [Clostridium sp. CCUG 7971]
MSSYVKIIYDKIDFLEFKQDILFLKQPQHKASIFQELTLDDFLKIRDFTNNIEDKILNGEHYDINQYEKELFDIWPPVRSLPSSSTLVAKALMHEDIFNSLFKNNN